MIPPETPNDIYVQQKDQTMEDGSRLPVVSFKNITQVIERVRVLQEQARLVVAGKLLQEVEKYLEKGEHRERKAVKAAVRLLEKELKAPFDELRFRAAECSATLEDWHADDWIVAQTFMGITTSYKHDADGSLWVKLHGTMEEVRVMDQLATIREVDLFKTWVPFCDKSTLLKRLGIVELLVYFNTSMPGVSRDCVMHAYGCDSVLEDNCVLLQGRSVDRWEGVEIPEVKGWRHARMDIRAFKAKFEVLSPTSACTSIVTNVDLKAPLPRSVVNFLLRKVAGMFLYCLKQAARRITADENNPHRLRILEDEAFYKHWLYPRFQQFYSSRSWSFHDGFTTEGGSSRRAAEPSRGRGGSSSVKTNVDSRRFCGGFRFKAGQRIKQTFGSLRKRRQQDSGAVDTPQPQVETLGIDPRLVERWQAKKETRLRDGREPRVSSARLVAYTLAAMIAAFVHWLCVSDEREACRARAALMVLFSAAIIYLACEFVAS